ncbi:MAG: MTH1187 family thiamine-binding protein [Bacteroidales bacterium]|nr:MTH1187 family thiamine-binding protein [Bacteroidales bacterium]
MSVLMEFAMFPTDKGESVSEYVSRIIKLIRENKYDYKLTAMGTIVETETIDEALKIVSEAYKTLSTDCNRVYCNIKFDIRKNKNKRLEGKIASIKNKIGDINC